MLENENKMLIIQRLFIFIVLYLILEFFLEYFLETKSFYKFYTNILVISLAIDIVFHIIYIVKDFGLLKLFIVIQNVLVKIMFIALALIVVYTTYYDDNVLSQIFLGIVVLGMITYPLFIIFFLIDTYKGIDITMNKSVFLILTNGVVLYLLSFLIKTEYKIDTYNAAYLDSLDFEYGMGLVYIPLVVAMFVYISSLFKSKEKL